MKLFTKKKLSLEQELHVKRLKRQSQKCYDDLEKMPDGTKEKGDKLLEYISLKEEQFKISSTIGDNMGLKAVKILYKTGLRQGKWKK